jgi:hypothetical protein
MTATVKSGAFGEGFSRVKAPQGFMLVKLIHDSYGTVVEMILELVQNGIDANARHVAIIINKKTRCITVADDGDGVTKEKYEAALLSVMKTQKSRDKLGQFGMGMLSPLAKCKWHKLTSCPKDGTTYLEWTFETEAIRAQEDEIFAPHRVRTDIRHESDPRGFPKGITKVPYRTLVEVHKYTDDKYISRIPDAQALFDEIVQNYREKMLENEVKLSVTIMPEKGDIDCKEGNAQPYTGHRLPDVKLYDGHAGHTFFHLYLARKNEKGKYIGQGVSMGEADNAFRFKFRSFARTVAGGVLSSAVVEALNSGVFEGDILTERTKLHSNRRSFVPGDALLGFCEAIETWYDQVGKEHYEAAVDTSSTETYKALQEELKKTLEDLLSDPKFDGLFKKVSQGLRREVKKPDKEGEPLSGVPGAPPRERQISPPGPDHVPGPKPEPTTTPSEKPNPPKSQRKQRATTKSERLGLEIRHGDIDDERKLWSYEPGILTFNILHSKWRECEQSQRRLKQLQEWVAIQVIMLQMMPEGEWRDHAEAFAEEMIDPFIYLLKSSPNFQHIGRMKGKKDAD